MSDGNATQTPFARPAIYKVEAVGRRGERQGAMPGQFRQLYGAQAFQPAGISLVSGSSFRAPPRVFVVKVPGGNGRRRAGPEASAHPLPTDNPWIHIAPATGRGALPTCAAMASELARTVARRVSLRFADQ